MSGQTLSIGGLTLDPDASYFTIDRYGIYGATGRLNKVRHIWKIHSRVNGANIAAVDAKVVAVEGAVKDGIDIVFSLGSTMRLISANCAESTHIKQFSWLPGYDGVRGSGAEAVLRRTFSLIVYGDVLQNSDTDVTAWQESIRAIGTGGANIVPARSLYGVPQPQQLSAQTEFWMVQSGSAVGLTSRPTPPLPQYEFVSGVFYPPLEQSIGKTTPKRWGRNANSQFGISWSYKCWSANSLIGVPSNF